MDETLSGKAGHMFGLRLVSLHVEILEGKLRVCVVNPDIISGGCRVFWSVGLVYC